MPARSLYCVVQKTAVVAQYQNVPCCTYLTICGHICSSARADCFVRPVSFGELVIIDEQYIISVYCFLFRLTSSVYINFKAVDVFDYVG